MAKQITKEELRHINNSLPNVLEVIKGEGGTYNKLIISVFERWMTKEEYENYDDVDLETLKDRRIKYSTAINEIHKLTQTYIWKQKRHSRVVFLRPNNLDQLMSFCKIKTQTFATGRTYDILLPEYSSVFSQEDDWSNILWYKEKNKIEPILEIIKNSGLYVISEHNIP